MIPNSYKYAAILVALGLSYYAGYTSKHEVVKRELEIVEVDKWKTRNIVKYITRPDGTKEEIHEDITEVDRTKKKKELTVANNRKWLVSLSAPRDAFSTPNPRYTLSLARRVSQNVYMGLYVDTEKSVGVTLGFRF